MNMASVQAACANSTFIPYMTGDMNISLGCFGCRKTTDIGPDEMLVGIPWTKMEEVVDAADKTKTGPFRSPGRSETERGEPFMIPLSPPLPN